MNCSFFWSRAYEAEAREALIEVKRSPYAGGGHDFPRSVTLLNRRIHA
jgi:hypothetical protein